MTRLIEFYGYHDEIPIPAEQHDNITQDQLLMIYEKLLQSPAGKATAFECEDYLHAIKVADYMRKSLGKGYTVAARRELVYIQGKA